MCVVRPENPVISSNKPECMGLGSEREVGITLSDSAGGHRPDRVS
jgi:hypothetical protein